MNVSDYEDSYREQYEKKIADALAKSPRFTAIIHCVSRAEDELNDRYGTSIIPGSEKYHFAITQQFSDADSLLKWLKSPLGELDGQVTQYYIADMLRTRDQGNSIRERAFDLNAMKAFATEASVAAAAKQLFLKECRDSDIEAQRQRVNVHAFTPSEK